MCQFACCAISADNGSPSGPPTPSDALISVIEDDSFTVGSVSRITLIPSGITAPDMPRNAVGDHRPQRAGERADQRPEDQQTVDARRTRRLPYMSPRRPKTGAATAADSKVGTAKPRSPDR
jgi:hypothetical protein